MPARIEDYALIGDLHTSALVSREGAIDWLCLPRLDSDACFAALLGDESNGHWTLAPVEPVTSISRRYRPGTLVLETTVTTAGGTVEFVDFMPVREHHPVIVRIVTGVSGRVRIRSTLALRFAYGRIRPYFTHSPAGYHAQAGPDAILHIAPGAVDLDSGDVVSEFEVGAGQSVAWQSLWYRPWALPPTPREPFVSERITTQWWQEWSATATYDGPHREAVVRSLITLKALTYAPTGAIAAAATTSLPEAMGGERNWDYRYTWLRDASMTLQALLREGYRDEAYGFRGWVLRAVAGDPQDMQIMYSITGKRHLPEWTLDWLSGYGESRPVRVGNGAAGQFQLDVYGELCDAAFLGRSFGMTATGEAGTAWNLQLAVARFVEQRWREPDEGIWEVRGAQQHFTYSKVMAWVAIDRTARSIREFGMPGDPSRWESLAEEIHAEVCARAVDPERNCFTQAYGSTAMDASLLMLPLVGFLPPQDERIVNTIREVERELGRDGLLLRYLADTDDGLSGEEGSFLICSFWLVAALALIGERERAEDLFDRLLGLCNDVGLLSEEYDIHEGRMLGNFPQAFSHLGVISAAHALRPPR